MMDLEPRKSICSYRAPKIMQNKSYVTNDLTTGSYNIFNFKVKHSCIYELQM